MRGFFLPFAEEHPMRAVLLTILLLSGPASAWEGKDLDTGANVDIDQGTLIRTGATIRFYDYGAGEYRSGLVTAISVHKGTMDVQIDDEKSERSRTLAIEN